MAKQMQECPISSSMCMRNLLRRADMQVGTSNLYQVKKYTQEVWQLEEVLQALNYPVRTIRSSRVEVCMICRLYLVQKEREAKRETVRWLQEHPVDPQTGIPLFTPRTGRAPADRQARSNATIGEHLYQKR